MRILKFGGTSVGSPERMKSIVELIDDDNPKIVVLSAVSGTTNTLVELNLLHASRQAEKAENILDSLRAKYNILIEDLYDHPLSNPLGWNVLEEHFSIIKNTLKQEYSLISERIILAQGELISTKLFHYLLLELGIDNEWLPALDFMVLNKYDEPDLPTCKSRLKACLEQTRSAPIYITQGYICKNQQGEIDNLKRGGSDYTATILGAICGAEEIQIWTDIDGVHNNDPRIVEETFPIKNLSYREAAELAYFGAKILHPTCVLPAEKENIPIRLKNTMDPQAAGTLISELSSKQPVTAIAAKDGISMINIHSHRMLMASGFLRKVFQIFEKYNTPIDMITTSEVAVSLTIDNNLYLNNIIEDLASFGEVNHFRNQTIVCLVGDQLDQHTGYAHRIFNALSEVPIRMISYGGSKNNVSILINSSDKVIALQDLNKHLFKQISV